MVRCPFLASGVVCLKAALRAMVAMVKSAIDRHERASDSVSPTEEAPC